MCLHVRRCRPPQRVAVNANRQWKAALATKQSVQLIAKHRRGVHGVPVQHHAGNELLVFFFLNCIFSTFARINSNIVLFFLNCIFSTFSRINSNIVLFFLNCIVSTFARINANFN